MATVALDIENTVQSFLNSKNFKAYALPLPANFADNLPCALVQRVGGNRNTFVYDTHAIAVDVYADTWAEATDNANRCMALLEELNTVTGAVIYGVTFNLPYNNPDPDSPRTPRVSFNAQITAKTTFTS